MPSLKVASRPFERIDWNWNEEIWNHWLQLEQDDGATAWQEIGWAVVISWSKSWEGTTRYEVHQEAWSKVHRLDAKDVPATWLYKLRTTKCIPDAYGELRLPSEMFRRTPDTLALLDVEPFVNDRWDQPGRERLFDELGVRTQPTDANKLLDRLRALAQVESPPIGPLRDLYRAIERVLPRLSVDRRAETLNAFGSEPLVRTEAAWERSGFCFRENPSGIPGVSLVHPDVRDVIGLWDTLKIASRPSAADSLRWIASLPMESALSTADRNAAVKVLNLAEVFRVTGIVFFKWRRARTLFQARTTKLCGFLPGPAPHGAAFSCRSGTQGPCGPRASWRARDRQGAYE